MPTDWKTEVRFPEGAKDFSIIHSVQTGSEANPASYSMGTKGSVPGVKQSRREADHSPRSTAEVKNEGAIPPLPHVSSRHNA
jgi:hypothetical protein